MDAWTRLENVAATSLGANAAGALAAALRLLLKWERTKSQVELVQEMVAAPEGTHLDKSVLETERIEDRVDGALAEDHPVLRVLSLWQSSDSSDLRDGTTHSRVWTVLADRGAHGARRPELFGAACAPPGVPLPEPGRDDVVLEPLAARARWRHALITRAADMGVGLDVEMDSADKVRTVGCACRRVWCSACTFKWER